MVGELERRPPPTAARRSTGVGTKRLGSRASSSGTFVTRLDRQPVLTKTGTTPRLHVHAVEGAVDEQHVANERRG
jgi:hypothetical protein